MASAKTKVIEYLFEKHWDKESACLTKTIMTMDDVAEGIRYCNSLLDAGDKKNKLSDKNPANFLKDIVRKSTASQNWPESIGQLKYTAKQRTGEGSYVFEFIRYAPGQTEPFPDVYQPSADTPKIPLQSISMTLASKALGRRDEAWLVQTAVNLKVIEAHFAVSSPLDVRQLTHLQMTVKLRKTEIDALFLAAVGSDYQEAMVTCEAKQHDERLLDDQIIEQVRATFAATNKDIVIPIGVRAVKGVGVYVVEFDAVAREELDAFHGLTKVNDAVYRFEPPVPGI